MATNTHPEAQWFESANFGLFIHWNIFSVDKNRDHVTTYPVELEEGRGNVPDNYLPPEEYSVLAEEFDPDAYDPDEWLAAAREAGMEYAVLTTKHHQGFALWPSGFGEFSTKQYLDGRDLVGEFVDACRRQGLRPGFYFSLPDWHHPDFPRRDADEELNAKFERKMPEYAEGSESRHVRDDTIVREGPPLSGADELVGFERYYKFVKGQIRELMTRYGRIDHLWFDNPLWHETLDHRLGEIYSMIRAEQPHIVINGRTGYTEFGDYLTPERRLPEKPLDGWWELCQPWGENWAYDPDDEYDDLDWTLERLSKTVARGGNLLLNVGPKANGEFPEQAYERLDALGEWMGHSRPAVEGAEAGPWPPRTDVPVTRTTGTWFIHALRDAGEIAVEDVPRPASVRLVRTGEALAHEYDDEDDRVRFEVGGDRRESGDEVVALSWPRDQHHLL